MFQIGLSLLPADSVDFVFVSRSLACLYRSCQSIVVLFCYLLALQWVASLCFLFHHLFVRGLRDGFLREYWFVRIFTMLRWLHPSWLSLPVSSTGLHRPCSSVLSRIADESCWFGRWMSQLQIQVQRLVEHLRFGSSPFADTSLWGSYFLAQNCISVSCITLLARSAERYCSLGSFNGDRNYVATIALTHWNLAPVAHATIGWSSHPWCIFSV